MLADLHTHTSLCKHAEGLPGEYLKFAAKAGLDFLGVSDHCPWPRGFDHKWRMEEEQYPEYSRLVSDLAKMSSLYGTQILYGLEVDYVPGRMEEVWLNLNKEPFDYLIGSVHYVDGFPMDSPDDKDRWKEAGGNDYIWKRYAESLLEFTQQGGFNIIGHCDIPKKFGPAFHPSDEKPFRKKMQEVFECAASKGIAIELNTAGLRKESKEIYPSLELLKSAKEAGVKICFGSDAHLPEEVAFAFSDALALAKAAGYREWTLFRSRKPCEHPIPEIVP